MKKFNVNWIVNIDKKTKLKVTGDAIYTGKFSKNEISTIQKLYRTSLDFESSIKIDNINYKYRRSLNLEWEGKQNKELGIIMFNPSFASPDKSDDTARNAVKFAYHHNYNKITIVNLLPIRMSDAKIVGKYYNTDFKKLKKDSIDKESLDLLPKEVVIAWGKLPENIDNINTVLEELKNNLKGKILYQITNEDFQRHLSSPSINSCGGIKKLELVKIKKLHLF